MDAMSSPHHSSLFPLGAGRNIADTTRGHLQCLVTWLGQRGTNTAPGGTAYPSTVLRAMLPWSSDRSSPQLPLVRCWGVTGRHPEEGLWRSTTENFQSPLSNASSAGQTCHAPHLSSAWLRHSRSLHHCLMASWEMQGAERGWAEERGSPSRSLAPLHDCRPQLPDVRSLSYCTLSFQHWPARPPLTSTCLVFPCSCGRSSDFISSPAQRTCSGTSLGLFWGSFAFPHLKKK